MFRFVLAPLELSLISCRHEVVTVTEVVVSLVVENERNTTAGQLEAMEEENHGDLRGLELD